MTDLEDLFFKTLFMVIFMFTLIWGFAIVHDMPPHCWLSAAPFTCGKVAELEQKLNP